MISITNLKYRLFLYFILSVYMEKWIVEYWKVDLLKNIIRLPFILAKRKGLKKRIYWVICVLFKNISRIQQQYIVILFIRSTI